MSFENLMKSVALRNSLGELDIRDNRCYITIDDRMEVAAFQANGKFYLHGVLASLPENSKDQNDLLHKLLQKNLGLAMTQRVSLCLEPDSDTLSLYLIRPLQGLNEDIIEDTLGEFANNFEYLLGLVSEGSLAMPSMPTMIMP